MVKSSCIVVCSSPNGRGISKYARYLTTLTKGRLITCSEETRYFVIWEIVGILRNVRSLASAEEVVFANTRVSPLLWMFLKWDRITVAVHDLMDTNAKRVSSESQWCGSKGLVLKINSWLMRESIRRAGKVIFNSSCTKLEVKNWLEVRQVKSAVVYPPPSFGDCAWTYSGILGEERESSKKFHVLAVAGMSENKAYDEYREFQEGLRARVNVDMKLVIYGIELKRAKSEFIQWVREQGELVEIKYKRSETELLDDYLQCDLFVSLSRDEGYGMPVADALAFGIPVVARSICSYREIKQEFDEYDLITLVDSVNECIGKAATIARSQRSRERKSERMRRYRGFYNRSQTVAKAKLLGLGVV